ncbi:peptide deformylase [Paracoccus sp. SM22M-07]|uniref:peptide deformylase n=1 Tax=Paracoccus sp. SM22M-07 TaxID=1520813 RepID=UPI00091B4631|nr:peptide deformylase [Paracoccus sp. SM22M-07]OJH45563.1 peptide deformylase [Paracoccus sp. SM22M-07]
MSLRTILIHPDPRLKKVAEPIARITPEIETLAADMLATMYDAPGIGLAAPQIGVGARIFVMDATRDPEAERAPIVMVNPQITWTSEALNTYDEGCLSIPDQYADVTRPAELRMEWLGLDGKTHDQEFDGLWATCAQHELDHLDGILFIDHLSAIKRQMITRKMVKFKREQARG